MTPDARRHTLTRRRWLVLGALGLLLAYVGASWVASSTLLQPRRRAPSPPPDLELESLRLTTHDGVDLAAWVVAPAAPPRAVVVLFHGIHGHRQADRLAFLAERGFAAVAIDHRAHGDSGAALSGFGWHERLDVLATVDFARARWPDAPLLGWGTSMGAAALVYAATEPRPDGDGVPPRFDGLVLESVYADIDTAYRNRVRLHAGAWMLPFAQGARWLAVVRGGLEPERMRPAERLSRLADVPLLLTGGADDRRAPPGDLLLRHASLAPHAEVEIVGGLGHTDLFRRGPADYGERVAAFLGRCADGGGSR